MPARGSAGRTRKTRRLDNMGLHIQARAKTQNRPVFCGMSGLKKCDLHSVMESQTGVMNCLNKSSPSGELVHCTQVSR